MGAYIRLHGIQLVHAFDVPSDIFAIPAARWYGVPAVVSSQLSYRSMYPASRRAALRLADCLSDRVVTNSQAVGDSLRRTPGFPANKLYLCYNGVNPVDFHPGPGIRVPQFEGASLIVGSVCVMRPEKRMDWLLEAFAEVSRAEPGMRLLLVGSGPKRRVLPSCGTVWGSARSVIWSPRGPMPPSGCEAWIFSSMPPRSRVFRIPFWKPWPAAAGDRVQGRGHSGINHAWAGRAFV